MKIKNTSSIIHELITAVHGEPLNGFGVDSLLLSKLLSLLSDKERECLKKLFDLTHPYRARYRKRSIKMICNISLGTVMLNEYPNELERLEFFHVIKRFNDTNMYTLNPCFLPLVPEECEVIDKAMKYITKKAPLTSGEL